MVRPAPLLRRLLAYLVDAAIVILPLGAVYLAVVPGAQEAFDAWLATPRDPAVRELALPHRNVVRSLSAVALVFVSSALEASVLEGTIGKKLFGLRVHSGHGHRLSLPQAFVRNVYKLLGGACVFLGWLVALTHPARQAWHDRMTHSVVLTNLASVALLCDPEAAVPLCAEALARARAGVRPSLLGMALVMHSDLDRVQGRPELALDRLEEATEVLEGTRTWLDAQLRIVATHAELGQQAIARVLLDSLPPAQTRSQRMVALAARAHLVLAETGETAEATRILQALDTQQLGTMVQDQVDLAVELHRGLWAPPSP